MIKRKMKALIIYISIHQKNTEKIAKMIASILKAKLLTTNKANINTFTNYDLIGFGSGIYYGKHHKSLLNLIDNLPVMRNKKAFIFSTSGMRNGILQLPYSMDFNKVIKERLTEKGFNIIGEFSCRGFDAYGPLQTTLHRKT